MSLQSPPGKTRVRPSRVILYILEKKSYFEVKDEVCLKRNPTRNPNPSFPLPTARGRGDEEEGSWCP